MSYADSLLATSERIVHRERQHWLVLLWGARLPIIAIVIGIVFVLISRGLDDPLPALLGWVGAAFFLGGLAFLVWATLQYLNREYVLTNRRVIEVAGVVNKRSTDSSLEKINDAVLTQSIFGRMFGFGDLEVLTASEAGIERFRMLVNPIGFKKAMMDAKLEYERDMSGSFRAPGPPIRETGGAGSEPSAAHEERVARGATDVGAAVPPRPPAPAPVAPVPVAPVAPPPAAAPRDDPDEITRTLANLADLHDRGAISAEEYESKKADLLGRL
jgi:hypothetical protein